MMCIKNYKSILWMTLGLGLLGTAGSFIAQYGYGLNPCPLCIFQRVSVMGVAIFSIIALLFPIRRWISRVLTGIWVSIPAVFGWGVAARQLYLQSLPKDQVPACGPGLNFMVQTMPFTDMISKVLTGSGECAEVQKFWAIPLPIWSIVLFSCVLLLLWWGVYRTRNH